MKDLTALVLVIACASSARLPAQTAAATPKAVTAAPKAVAARRGKSQRNNQPSKRTNRLPTRCLARASWLNTNEPTTTEIYADEAFFDSTKNMGTFSGRVKVTDPRFNLQSDKLTVFITKGENQGLEKAIAEGNVGLVRDRPTRTVARQRAQLGAQTKRLTQPRLGT